MKLKYAIAAALALPALAVIASCVRNETTAKQDQEVPPAIRYEAHVSAGGAAPAAGTLSNPHKGDKQSAETGAGLFGQMNCDGCHGGGGLGWAAPSLSDGRWRFGGAEYEIFQSIYYGRPKGMPAYGGVLGTEGVWLLVTYLQSLPVPDAVPTQSYEATAETKPPMEEATPPAGAGPTQPAVEAPDSAAAPVQAASTAGEQSAEAMMTKYGCVACHAKDRKVIGPSFKDVAAKYRNQKDAADLLADRVKNGSVGVWGQIPMPPNAAVPDEDLHKLVEWMLSVK
ncbi:MAG: c-type cytochrome [bacterium]